MQEQTVLTYECTLENFEGPLDFLVQLVQKNEIRIHDVKIQEITAQFATALKGLEEMWLFETGPEFIGTTATLLWLKSKTLIPRTNSPEDEDDLIPSSLRALDELVDYCKYKILSKDLLQREEVQGSKFARTPPLPLPESSSKPRILSLDDLTRAYQDALLKEKRRKETVLKADSCTIEDQIQVVQKQLHLQGKLSFIPFLLEQKSRIRTIFTFLAILELMKQGAIVAVRREGDEIGTITLYGRERSESDH